MHHSGWQSLHFPLNFAVNLKLFEKKQVPKKWDREKIETEIIEEEMKENESKKKSLLKCTWYPKEKKMNSA